jgi:hypothetical protein
VKGDRNTPGVDIVEERRAARERAQGRRDHVRAADVRTMRGRVYQRALAHLERETSRPVAVVTQAVRLSHYRKAHDSGD